MAYGASNREVARSTADAPDVRSDTGGAAMIRDDICDTLAHLTKGPSDAAAAANFVSIVQQSKLIGGDGFIKGGHRCVCFSEAPISKLAAILAAGGAGGKYKPFGVMVKKHWLYAKGARPVIYQSDAEYRLLAEEQQYRHVRYEPGTADFTWEREWRLHADELTLDPVNCTLIVPTRAWEQWAQDQHLSGLRSRSRAFGGWASTPAFPWHFVVLSDLGVRMEAISPPPP